MTSHVKKTVRRSRNRAVQYLFLLKTKGTVSFLFRKYTAYSQITSRKTKAELWVSHLSTGRSMIISGSRITQNMMSINKGRFLLFMSDRISVGRMQDRLGLDESQVQELKTLLASQYEKRKEAIEANRAEIEKILTPEQAETFKAMQAERARHHKAGPGHHRHHPGHHGCCCR